MSAWGRAPGMLVDDVGERVVGVGWISTCGSGSGEHHFLSEPESGTVLEELYAGCGNEAPAMSGTRTMRHQGIMWTSLVGGEVVHQTAANMARTVVAVEVLRTKPFSLTPRGMTIDGLQVSVRQRETVRRSTWS